MIKSLISRRFWWSISEERTSDCDLVWTQIKVIDIFAGQERAKLNKAVLKEIEE